MHCGYAKTPEVIPANRIDEDMSIVIKEANEAVERLERNILKRMGKRV
jgi:hypothetical protein